MIARLATQGSHAIVLAYGWRRALIAMTAGAASALALAPFNGPVTFDLLSGAGAGAGGVTTQVLGSELAARLFVQPQAGPGKAENG